MTMKKTKRCPRIIIKKKRYKNNNDNNNDNMTTMVPLDNSTSAIIHCFRNVNNNEKENGQLNADLKSQKWEDNDV